MNTKEIITVFFLLIVSDVNFAQDTMKVTQSFQIPKMSIVFKAGTYEALSLTAIAKLNERSAIYVKSSMYILNYDDTHDRYDGGDGVCGTGGVGVGFQYYFRKLVFFNYVGVDGTIFIDNEVRDSYAIQCVLGEHSTLGNGFSIHYELGVAFSSGAYQFTTPSFQKTIELNSVARLGFSYNF